MGDRDLGKTIVVRMDASILISRSDKEHAAGTFKHLRSSSIEAYSAILIDN